MEYLERLEECMEALNLEEVTVKYVGGLRVLFIFPNSDEAKEFLERSKDKWSAWFSKMEVWDGNFNSCQRIAWIRITGVPVCLWDRHVFNRIGERCGRVLSGSDASSLDSDLSAGKMAILVNSGEKVSSEFSVSSGGQSLKVWVNEYETLWAPTMPEPRSASDDLVSPVLKSKIVMPEREDETDRRLEDDSVGVRSPTVDAWEEEGVRSCMGSPHNLENCSTDIPDGFTLRFFKRYWAHLKPALMRVMSEFHETGRISFGCNATFIALIPKIPDCQNLSDFRPISLVSSVYKIIAKVLALSPRLLGVGTSWIVP
ncbi:putative RNA-directed DNA polymerase [Helianthus anomalus]